jgi:hypothetical protein
MGIAIIVVWMVAGGLCVPGAGAATTSAGELVYGSLVPVRL